MLKGSLRARWERGRGLVLDTGWTGASELVRLVSGLVVLNALIIGLGPAGYGRYVAVTALSAVLVTLSSVWLVFLLLQRTLQEGVDLRVAFTEAVSLAAPAAVLALVAGSLLGALLIPGLSLAVVACFVGAELLGSVLVLLSAAAVQVARGLGPATRLRVLLVLTKVVVVVTVAVLGRTDLPSLAVGLLVGNALLGVAVFLHTTASLGLRRLPGRPGLSHAREGLPYAGVLASFAVQEDADKVFLVRLVDPVDAGLYAAAYRIVQLGFLPINALMGSSHQRFLSETPGVRGQHLRRALAYTGPTALYGVVATVGLVVLGPLVPRVLGAEYDGTPPLLAALAPLVLLRSLSLFPLNALLGLKRFGLRFRAIAACTLLNLALNAALVPAVGVDGAVLATVGTEVALVLVAWACVAVTQARDDRRGPARGDAPAGTLEQAQDPVEPRSDG